MGLYKVQSRTIGKSTDQCGSDWLCIITNDAFPEHKASLYEEKLVDSIEDDDLERLIRTRSPYLGKSLNPTLAYKEPSLASDEEDFWSFDTLEQFLRIAERRGAAVCQLLKQCSDSELDGFMESLGQESYSVAQLKRLLHSTKANSGDGKSKVTLPDDFDRTNRDHLKRLKEELKDAYIPFGTGFLVGKNYLLTNNHVLQSPEEARKCIARFRYDRNSEDDKTRPVDYNLDSTEFAYSPESKLDYTLVKLLPLGEKETKHLTGKAKDDKITEIRKQHGLQFLEAGENFGWLPLFADDALVAPPLPSDQVKHLKDKYELKLDEELLEKALRFGLPGEPVNIIQHPRGKAKEIVFYSNRVQKLTENYLYYQADTDLGSSGSPVFNSQWQVVALHHAVLVEVKDENQEIKSTVQGSIGIRISAIVKHLENSEDPAIQNLYKSLSHSQFIIKKNSNPRRGRIYILAGVDREDLGIEDKELKEAEATLMELADKIQNAEIQRVDGRVCTLKDYGYSVVFIQPPDGYKRDEELMKENVIKAWVEQRNREKDLEPGDIAIELSMDVYTDKQQKTRGVSIYYAGTRDERERQAELVLKTLLNQKISLESTQTTQTIETCLPNRGVRSDQTVLNVRSIPDEQGERLPGLPFCQDIGIPSFVLRLGFIDNSNDRKAVKRHSDAIAEGIAKGLLMWGNSINPIPAEIYQAQNEILERLPSQQYLLSF